MDDDDKVRKLGVKFKGPPSDEQMLKVVRDGGCDHRIAWVNNRMVHASYLIREGETEVECGFCGTRLDPMFVLRLLAHEETTWLRTRKAYQDEMKRLAARRRTKCEYCGRMTRISRS